jgi:dTDP-4-amino-4,6-dideoxygalactose transaminase
MKQFAQEISLPVYYDLSNEDIVRVGRAIINALDELTK